MNQEQNNLNPNNFNTQGNNGIPNNQPLNNQSFNQGMGINQQPINPQQQPIPSFQQPINQMNMQQPTPQPINTFESGNTNNQNFNSKPPKKMNLGLIIGIVAAVAVVGVGIVFGSKLLSNSGNNGLNNSQITSTQETLNDNEFKIIYNIESITEEFWNSKENNQNLTNIEIYQKNFKGHFGINQGGVLSAQPVGFTQELHLYNGLFYKLTVENNDFLFHTESLGNANTHNDGVTLSVLGNDLALYNIFIGFQENPSGDFNLTKENNWQFIKTYSGTFNDEDKFIAYKYIKDNLYLKIEFNGYIRNNKIAYYLYDESLNKSAPTYSEKNVENIENEMKTLLIEKVAPLISYEEMLNVKEYNLRNKISDDLESFDQKLSINYNNFKHIYLYYKWGVKDNKIIYYFPQFTGLTKSNISLEINQYNNEENFKHSTFYNEYFSSKKSSFNEKEVYIIVFSPSSGQTYYNGVYFEHDGLYYKVNRQINTNETTEENYVNETLKDVFSFK